MKKEYVAPEMETVNIADVVSTSPIITPPHPFSSWG